MRLDCFKANDIRGKLGIELDEAIAYRIGRAYAQYLGARRIADGGDVRPTSAALKLALANGMMDAGADVGGYRRDRHRRDVFRKLFTWMWTAAWK